MSRRLAVLLAVAAALTAAPASAAISEHATFGSAGSGPGQFQFATSVALDSSNRAFVSDCTLGRIEVFNPDHTFLTQFGTPGVGPRHFRCPFDIATQGDSYIYVSDIANKTIDLYSGFASDTPLDYIGSYGLHGTDDQPCAAYGIAVDATGAVWAAGGPERDECQVVTKFNRRGDILASFGSRGTGRGQFYGYMHVATDAAGNAYVSDYANGRVQKFDSHGSFGSSFGENGTGDGDFYGPHGLTVDPSGNPWVTETGINYRFQEFTPGDQFAAKFALGGPVGPSSYLMPYDVTSDANCNVYVVATTGVGDGPEGVHVYGQSEAPYCRVATPAPAAAGGGPVSGDPTPGADPPTPPDTASPAVVVTATAARFSVRQGFTIPFRCNEDCTLVAGAQVSIPNGAAKVYGLSGRAKAAKGKTVKLVFHGKKPAKKAIAAALARGRKLKAKLRLTTSDAKGNVAQKSATVKLR